MIVDYWNCNGRIISGKIILKKYGKATKPRKIFTPSIKKKKKKNWLSSSTLKIAVGLVIMSEARLFGAFLLREIALSTFSFRVPFDLDHR